MNLSPMLGDDAKRGPEGLSERQIQCLTLASQGLTSKEIARQIGIAPSTVDNHMRVAAAKLQVANRREAIRRLAGELPRAGLSDAGHEDDAERGQFTGKIGLLPPVGGAPNTLSAAKRLGLVLRIALLATMAFAAIVTTISGIVLVLSR